MKLAICPQAGRLAVVVVAALLAAIGVVRIVSTYHVFNDTVDEPAAVAAV